MFSVRPKFSASESPECLICCQAYRVQQGEAIRVFCAGTWSQRA
ncbi:hypothetical protein PSN_2860 [Pseudomonas sp. NGC7]